MNNNFLDFFKSVFDNNKMGHAYLIANTNYNHIGNELNEIVKKYIFCNDLDMQLNPDVYIIEPDGSFIKKEQILDLENKIVKHSQGNNKKVYILSECEKLHSSSSNSLLKTLEEPFENVYAFLITNDINKILPTIKSRCQIIFLGSQKDDLNITNEEKEKYLKIIDNIDKNNTKEIIDSLKFLYAKPDKLIIKQILCMMQKLYSQTIYYITGIDDNIDDINLVKEISLRNNKNMLIKKIKVVNNSINLLEYNLNLGLLIDKFLIELRRCENG